MGHNTVTQGDGEPMPRKAAEGVIVMPSGGHARSGPRPDPNSLNSAKRGITFIDLPADGYQGEIPEFPLPDCGPREAELWAWAWRLPQAEVWAVEPWRQHAVAMWVRTATVCESEIASAADKGSLHRFADQIGLTPAGMAFNGWRVAADEVGARRADKAPALPPPSSSARDRMKALRGAAAG